VQGRGSSYIGKSGYLARERRHHLWNDLSQFNYPLKTPIVQRFSLSSQNISFPPKKP
jgi:hypothetical protein